MSHADGDAEVARTTRVMLRPVASPLPLGFFAFGIGSGLLSFQQLSVIPPADGRLLALILAVFVFPSQLLSAVFAFLAREPIAATVLALLSFSWPAVATATLAMGPGEPAGPVVGLFYLSLALVLLLLAGPALSAKPMLGAVITLAVARYVLLGVASLTGPQWLQQYSGAIGFAILAVALYSGLALALEDVAHRTVLPFPRFGEARRALETGVLDQARAVSQEAGVRRQL